MLEVDLEFFFPPPWFLHIGIFRDVDIKQLVAVVSIWRPHCIRQRDAGGRPRPGVPFSRRTFSPSFLQSFVGDLKKCVSLRDNKCQVVIPPSIKSDLWGVQISFLHECNNPRPEKDAVKPENMTQLFVSKERKRLQGGICSLQVYWP